MQAITKICNAMDVFSAAKVDIPVPPARTLQLIEDRRQHNKLSEINVS